MVIATNWRKGNGELFNGYRVSVLGKMKNLFSLVRFIRWMVESYVTYRRMSEAQQDKESCSHRNMAALVALHRVLESKWSRRATQSAQYQSLK